MVPSSRIVGTLNDSSPNSDSIAGGDEMFNNVINSHLNSSFESASKTMPGVASSSLIPDYEDFSGSMVNSGPSIEASSLVTDANSSMAGMAHLHGSSNMNAESSMLLPSSPMSFSSNISASGSSAMDVSSMVRHESHQVHGFHFNQNQQPQNGFSRAMPLSQSHMGNVMCFGSPRAPGSFIQEYNGFPQVQRKRRFEIMQGGLLHQQVVQQMQKQEVHHLPQIAALVQQQRFGQQQQTVPLSVPQNQHSQLQLQQLHQNQQVQLRHHLQQQGIRTVPAALRRVDTRVCARRLNQFFYHLRNRPQDNSLAYWRKFVMEYYSRSVKQLWCLSLHNNVGNESHGVSSVNAVDTLHCSICKSKPCKGFEANFNVLARFLEAKFNTGILDELFHLDSPREFRFPSGIMVLDYEKVIQETLYEKVRVVHEGKLRITFTSDLKILYWEFCVRSHDELLPYRLVTSQVSRLVQLAQKSQSTVAESGLDPASGAAQVSQNNHNMVVTAIRQLSRSLELPWLNEFGFSKRCFRVLQVGEVVTGLHDVMDICTDHKVGPIVQGTPRNTVNRLATMQPALRQQMAHVVTNIPPPPPQPQQMVQQPPVREESPAADFSWVDSVFNLDQDDDAFTAT